MNIIFYLLFCLVYFLLGLAPYYVAYLIIEPNSFLGIVGVFVLGSIIVPMTLFLASIIIASISRILGVASKENYNTHVGNYQIKAINENSPPKKSYKKIFIWGGFSCAILIFIFLLLLNNRESYQVQEPLNNEEDMINSYDDQVIDSKNEFNDGKVEYEDEIKISDSIMDDNNLMNMAVHTVLTKVNDKGISGVAKDIRDCYVNPNLSKLYCVYLDNSAKLLDIAVSSAYQIPRNEYLYDARVSERSYKYLYKPNNIIDFNSHISKIEGEIKTILHNSLEAKVSHENKIKSNKNTEIIEDRKFNEINENNRMSKNIPVNLNIDSEKMDDKNINNDEKAKVLMNENENIFTE